MIREAQRILKRKNFRIPQAVGDQVRAAVTELETALGGEDLDRTRNADGIRRPLTPLLPTPPAPRPAPGLAPLLEKLMGQARTSGLPPAYVPKDDLTPTDDQEPA